MSEKQTKKDKQERMWATFCHLSAFIGFVFPLGNILAPFLIWIIKREDFPLVNDQGKESINFQISTTIYYIIFFLLAFLLIGIPLIIVLAILEIIFIIKASIAANHGKKYH